MYSNRQQVFDAFLQLHTAVRVLPTMLPCMRTLTVSLVWHQH
jgi:hypothetical protein